MIGLRDRRAALGLSQAELAAASGLSRQQISAVESGRHSPSVAAALSLARALDTSVEELFGLRAATSWDAVMGERPSEGAPVVAARVGDRAVFHPLANKGATPEGWRRSDGVYRNGEVELFGDQVPEGTVVAGCDPILGLIADLLPSEGPRRVLAIHATSVSAARALHRDRIHAALVHGTERRLRTSTPRSTAVPVARWQVGLAGRRAADLDLAAIASGRMTIAHRPIGAEAERALRSAIARADVPQGPNGPVAEGHVETARLVADGVADVALTIGPVAAAFGFEFLPLEDHRVELRVDERWSDHPGVTSVVELFGSTDLARRLGHLGGYQLLQR